MGAAQSLPSEHRPGNHTGTLPPRTKLTKPRTNSITARDHPYRNRFSVSQPRAALPDVAHHLGPEPEALGTKCTGGGGNHLVGSVTLPVYANLGINAGLQDLEVTWVGGGERSTGICAVRHSRANSSAGSFTARNERDRTTAAVGTVRRRSQLLAAPPATATRRTKCQSLTMDYGDYVDCFSQQPYAAPAELDAGRCTTPSGYSVIGAFKRGSLRIVNGAASPAPSSAPASPRISAEKEPSHQGPAISCQGSNLGLARGVHRARSLESIAPFRGVRLVPSSPRVTGQDLEDGVPESPFSFAQSPTFEPGTDTMPDLDLGPNVEYPDSVFQEEVNFYDAFESLPIYDDDNDDEPVPLSEREQASGGVPLGSRLDSRLALERPNLQDCDGCSGADSGYSSTGSVNSRTTRSRMQHDASPVVMGEGAPFRKANKGSEKVEGAEPGVRRNRSMARSMIAAIKKRCSYGDFKVVPKAEPAPELPTNKPAVKVKRSLSLLRRRRSTSTVAQDQDSTLVVPSPLPAIEPVPPLPARFVNAEPFDHLVVTNGQDVHGLPGRPGTGHGGKAITDGKERQNDCSTGVGTHKIPRRGSKITGQDYYQRFSIVETIS
ncbi:unnamed protein product [Tuber melanosporum]|uniref:(Perigord truffle) hypothetical protein n=1 Tax=Tuber melanosporum (strain Mel28) TaxID=656061 RepID=D5GPQ1_TUBMM|nr:uncharacterized protein GSTUM_00011970001 [Tuber melanosporum]CAZ86494.1 unnamed protein product [Tuber melanosporum]